MTAIPMSSRPWNSSACLSATGPCGGKVKRPSDNAEPQKIAWIQCVGSRDAGIGREYCSSICCMQATKQAMIAREHDPRVAATIFSLDLRAQGKGFDRYYERAKGGSRRPLYPVHGLRVTQDPARKTWKSPMWTKKIGFRAKSSTW